jgi:PAS domain S-box-containing protein
MQKNDRQTREKAQKDLKERILQLEAERDAALKRVCALEGELGVGDAQQSAWEILRFIDSMPQLVWAAGPEGNVDFCNRQHEEFEGLAKNPDGNWDWKTAVHPDDLEGTVAAWESALQSGTIYEIEHRLRRADGSFGWYLSRAVPVRDSQERISRWYGTATDIDALKRAERALGAFFENVAAGMVEIDQDGRFLRANEKFCRISGYTWEELVQMTMAELTHPDDREEDLRKFNDFQRGITPTYETEKRYLRKDGQVAWIQVSAGMKIGDGGHPQRTAAVVRDITLQKEAEAALQEAESRLKLALDASGIGSWELDLVKNTVWRTLRHDQIFGYGSLLTEWSYGLFLEHVVAEDREEVDRKFQEALMGGDTWNFECRIRRADGAVRWIWAQGRTRRDKGKPSCMYGLVADVTERKTLEENLQKAQQAAEEGSRAKSEFLANMSHEIRTPMTVFMAALEHLLQIDRSPERRPFLEMADQAAQRLRALIDDILDFSRIEARRLDIQDEPFDLRACIRNSVAMMELKAREKNLGLEMDVSPEIPRLVSGDPDRLGQVLINLMGNAVKFTSAGEVKISVRLRGKDVEFAISDTGIGIPAEKKEELFQSFSQVDSSFTRRFGGTGLGLAISKGLVELMGGRIGVRSRPGGGSVFFFDLPMKPVAGPIPSKERVEAAETSFSEAHILIADDEPMIREMVLKTLAQRGWQAEIAVTGREAVRKWEEGNFDVVFMDLQMPEMDGLEATLRIREMENRTGRKTCIVGLTAHARPEVREQCLEAGMDMVLTKPVRMNELYSAIEDCLNI